MRAQHEAPDARIFFQTVLDLQTKIKARTLPVYPANGSFKKIFGDLFTFFRSGNGDGCIRMQVINMFEWKKSMQWRVDGGCF